MIGPRIGHSDAPLGLRHTVLSVLAAFFGVQSGRNRARDFSRGSAGVFICIALLLMGAFVAVLMVVVHLLLARAGL